MREAKAVYHKVSVLDVLINNAGINGEIDPYTVIEATSDQYMDAFKTNLVGTANVTQAFIDLLKKSAEPRIVNLSTSVGSLCKSIRNGLYIAMLNMALRNIKSGFEYVHHPISL